MPDRRELTESEQRSKKIAIRLAFICACLILIHFIIISIIFSWSDWIALLLFSLLFIVPAYISNASMVITGGGKPIDGGKNFLDGRRIFGDHKTWNGLLFGPLLIGIPISIAIFTLFLFLWPIIIEIPIMGIQQGVYHIYKDLYIFEYYFIGIGGPPPIGFLSLIIRIVLCAYGAAIGDLIGSFLKRRVNIKSGEPFWLADQLDFAIFAIIFTSIPAIFLPELFLVPDVNIIIFLLILTPSVSVIANTVAYFLGLKEVPW